MRIVHMALDEPHFLFLIHFDALDDFFSLSLVVVVVAVILSNKTLCDVFFLPCCILNWVYTHLTAEVATDRQLQAEHKTTRARKEKNELNDNCVCGEAEKKGKRITRVHICLLTHNMHRLLAIHTSYRLYV